jgi:hypothetical protein
MATFPLDEKFTATATPHRHGNGFLMKGALFYKGKLKETFEAQGRTLPAAEDAARARAEEIWRRLRTASVRRQSL